MAKGLTVLAKEESINKITALLSICEKYSNLTCFKKFRLSNFLKRFTRKLTPSGVSKQNILN